MTPRFHIGPELAAQVYTHASITIGLIDRLIARNEHYGAIMREMATQEGRTAAVDDSDIATKTQQQFDQLKATREELQRLADDAKQQGAEALRSLKPPGHHVKIDLSLKAPAPDAPVVKRALTLHVMQDATFRDFRDLGDQIQRLLIPLSKVADPATLVFAGELERLAKAVRPPGAPRGNYAPKHL